MQHGVETLSPHYQRKIQCSTIREEICEWPQFYGIIYDVINVVKQLTPGTTVTWY